MSADSTSLARREFTPMPVPVMSNDEIDRTYRLAQMFAASSLFKDVKQAEQAFAKLVVGRELGLNSIQSLQLYAMEGKIECPYPLLGARINERPGYSFDVLWRVAGADGWVADDDGREVTGCKVVFHVEGRPDKSSTWTREDSARAELDKPRGASNKPSMHMKYPRNMYLARALGQGVRFHVPEVVNGLQVYAEGELPARDSIGASDADADGPGWGTVPVPWVRAVHKLMRRAERLGRDDIADEALWQMRLVGQSPEVMQREMDDAKAELDAMAAARANAVPGTAEEEPPLAPMVEVVLARAEAAGHDGFSRADAERATFGQADEVVEAYVRESNAILDAHAERGVPVNPVVETGEGLERPAEDAAVADEPRALTPEEEAELERLRERLALVRTDPELADGADEIQGQIDALEARRQSGLF